MVIGITDTFQDDTYDAYESWLRSVEPTLTCQRLSYESMKPETLGTLDGLLLTGGGDVDPRYYHQVDRAHYAKNVHAERDAFEFDLIDHALDINLPILGVCRGMQVMNVYLGGSLVLDLVASRFDNHAGKDDEPLYHSVGIHHEHSLLHTLTQKNEVVVNSFHHQAIDRVGRGLMISALSHDGVVEAAEWAIKDSMPFLLLVQWHPERIPEDELSQKIALMFLRECRYYRQ